MQGLPFADDINPSNSNKSLKHLNKLINIALNNLAEWLNVNNTSLNIFKTEMVIFRQKNVLVQGLITTITGKAHIEDIAIELVRANSMLYKVRGILKSILIIPYFSYIFILLALYSDRMYAQSIVFSYPKRKHESWFISKNLTLI